MFSAPCSKISSPSSVNFYNAHLLNFGSSSSSSSVNKFYRLHNGFTLIELMITISLVAIISAIALPNYQTFLVKTRVDNQISRLTRLLLTTRNSAINLQVPVILCPLNASNVCSTEWQSKLTVFTDHNNNNQYDTGTKEVLITTKSMITNGDKLEYGLGRTRIKYAPTGRTSGWGSNGTLKYCPSQYSGFSRGIVVATSGRLYPSTDLNGDGKDQTRSNQNITCRQ
ncbi:MAG: GspH/FimT family pseudopilin [Colwellia sp.]